MLDSAPIGVYICDHPLWWVAVENGEDKLRGCEVPASGPIPASVMLILSRGAWDINYWRIFNVGEECNERLPL